MRASAIVSDITPPRLRRLLSAILLAGFFAGAAALPAGAQRKGAATAATDSTGRAIFGFLRPTYSTTYNISDQESAWNQKFDFQNTFGRFNLTSNTTYTIRTSPNRADFKAASGSTSNSLLYNLMDRIPLSATLLYSRDGTDDATNETRVEAVDARFDASYRWRIRRGLDLNSTGGLVMTKRRDAQQFSGDESEARESGLGTTLGGTLNYLNIVPGMSFKFDTKRTVAETKSTLTSSGEDTPEDEPKTNSEQTFASTWNYIPTEAFEIAARWDRRKSVDNFILISSNTTLNGRAETQEITGANSGLTLRYKPPKSNTTEATLDLTTTETMNTRALERDRSSDRSSRTANFKGRRQVRGVQVDAKFLLQLDEDRSPIRPGSETISRTLEMGVSDSLSRSVDARLLGEVGIRSQTYKDGQLDQDIQKLRAESSIGWKPSSRLSSTISTRFIRTNTVNIDSALSASSRNEDNFGATLDLRYNLTSRTTITQNYDFRILLTTFRFNPSGDDIQRTRTIRTSIGHQIMERLRIEMTHDFKYNETGRYGRQDDLSRIFLKANDRYDQDLRLAFTYAPTAWLSFRTDEWLHRDDDIRLADDFRRTSTRIEFNQSVSLNRDMPGGGTVTCTASFKSRQQLRPTVGQVEEYLNVNLALTKPF